MIRNIPSDAIVYISGPMTGRPGYNRRAFYRMEERIKKTRGAQVLNPARQPGGLRYREYMRRALIDLSQATHIVLLEGWETSRGALAEIANGRLLGLPFNLEIGAICPEINAVACVQTAGMAFDFRTDA